LEPEPEPPDDAVVVEGLLDDLVVDDDFDLPFD